jgi:hypothetical protein
MRNSTSCDLSTLDNEEHLSSEAMTGTIVRALFEISSSHLSQRLGYLDVAELRRASKFFLHSTTVSSSLASFVPNDDFLEDIEADGPWVEREGVGTGEDEGEGAEEDGEG